MRYLSLDPQMIARTVEALERRIGERFPDSSLRKVAADLVSVSEDAVERSARMRKPNRLLRGGVLVLVLLFAVLVYWFLTRLGIKQAELTFTDLIQAADALLESTVFVGASVLFLLTLDTRLKRRRVLQAIHELRALAHIVDMHQLTKDPEALMGGGPATPSSPRRAMTRFELARYLDYSSEMLSLTSKVAALYVQGFEDPVALSAVDEVEDLTDGFSRKIWQKIMILDQAGKTGSG